MNSPYSTNRGVHGPTTTSHIGSSTMSPPIAVVGDDYCWILQDAITLNHRGGVVLTIFLN